MKNESWKRFFLRAVNYIKLMKQEFNYEYTFGNFIKQYKILKDNKGRNDLLLNSSLSGELALVIWSLNIGANVHAEEDYALISASAKGHLEIVKYLVEAGADIHAENDKALIWASDSGHLETVKYLVEAGADIHTQDNYALRTARLFGRLEVIKYLKKKMKNNLKK
jgi:ankyrin repeat protein